VEDMAGTKPVLLTGDTPTGALHLGHYVGSIENRVALQDDYQSYFLLANTHAFSTHSEQPKLVREHVRRIALDYLACGIDPDKSAIFIESDVPAIFELTAWFSMLVPFPRLMRNPTIKDEIRDKQLGDKYSTGLLFYPLLQVADILAVRAEMVPVGEDQLPHLELTREVARKFNQLYCGVDPHTSDEDHVAAGGVFPIPQAKVGRIKRLVGLGGPGANGELLKMSKSLGNAILLSDDADTVKKKIMGMYTDPKRLRATDPGTVENNPLWIFHDTFNTDTSWVDAAKQRYRAGTIGDVECKRALIDVINAFLDPLRERYNALSNDLSYVDDVLRRGAEQANATASATLAQAKQALHQA
jgi:tryptophanyl-tRNA synthetase